MQDTTANDGRRTPVENSAPLHEPERRDEPAAETMATATPFDQIGGEAAVQRLVDRFYDLMELDESYAALRATHGPSLDRARQRLFWFLCGWLGGPQYFIERVGHPALRARHLPFSIGIRERDEWVDCMDRAMADTNFPESLRLQLLPHFQQTADWMRNRDERPAISRSSL